ncbi:hypothetical protein Hanom_Chr12g01095671 [Helianthus anomalus]
MKHRVPITPPLLYRPYDPIILPLFTHTLQMMTQRINNRIRRRKFTSQPRYKSISFIRIPPDPTACSSSGRHHRSTARILHFIRNNHVSRWHCHIHLKQ